MRPQRNKSIGAAVALTLAWAGVAIAVAVPSGAQRLAATYQPATYQPAAFYQPAAHTNWMWEIGTPLVTSSAKLMGTGVKAWNGDTAPGDNPTLYDVDAILNPASTVTSLHGLGDHAICYVEVGTAGNYYSAADEGVATTYFSQLKAAGDLGKKLSGYPEYFININAGSALSIIESMINKQCAGKGFDAVETDLDETFNGNEGATGFTITQANEESYLTELANYMHGIGLGWIAKNLDDTGVQSFVTHLEPLAQGIVTEQCNQYDTCSLLSPFRTDAKWIGNAEYAPETQAQFCAADNAANINGILFNVNLNGGRKPCR
jgi:Glycoside-hydrolase family GH114